MDERDGLDPCRVGRIVLDSGTERLGDVQCRVTLLLDVYSEAKDGECNPFSRLWECSLHELDPISQHTKRGRTSEGEGVNARLVEVLISR